MTPRRQHNPGGAEMLPPPEELAHEIGQSLVAAIEATKELVKTEEPAKEKPKPVKTCNISGLLTASVLELLKACPENDTIRSLAGNRLRQPIPEDKTTFADIKEWVEHNPDFAKPPTPPRPAFVLVALRKSGKESGACNYSVSTRGSQEFKLTDETIQRCARDAAHDASRFWLLITDHITQNEEIDMEWCDEPDYTDHESTDNEDGLLMWNRKAVDQGNIQLRLREIAPELYHNLWL